MNSIRWSTMQVSFHGTGGTSPLQPAAWQTCSPTTYVHPRLSGEDPVYFVKEGPGLYPRGHRVTPRGHGTYARGHGTYARGHRVTPVESRHVPAGRVW